MAVGRVVVMGVSGAGKTRVAMDLAAAMCGRFIEGDDLHPAANRAKMAAGTPLTDEDRWPWLDRVGAALAEGEPPVVAACSALRRVYRDRLRTTVPDLTFVHLDVDPAVVAERLEARKGHFMPPSLLASQFGTLERLQPDERAIVVDASGSLATIVSQIVTDLQRL